LKVASVTGANHGIGAATARALALQGVSLFLTYLRLPPLGTSSEQPQAGDISTPGLALYNFNRARTADVVIEQIRTQGGRAEALEANLNNLEIIPLLFDRAEVAFGSVDILINNVDLGSSHLILCPYLILYPSCSLLKIQPTTSPMRMLS